MRLPNIFCDTQQSTPLAVKSLWFEGFLCSDHILESLDGRIYTFGSVGEILIARYAHAVSVSVIDLASSEDFENYCTDKICHMSCNNTLQNSLAMKKIQVLII